MEAGLDHAPALKIGGTVRQLIERTADSGRRWQTTFDDTYRRTSSQTAAACKSSHEAIAGAPLALIENNNRSRAAKPAAGSYRSSCGITDRRDRLRLYFGRMETDKPQPIVVPYQELSAEALRGVVESFVLREGTDYGEREVSFEQKVAQVMRQLEREEAQIVFDAVLETVDIVVRK